MHSLARYEIEHCPRYEGEGSEHKRLENEVRQLPLMRALRYILVGQRGLSAELRLSSSFETRQNRIALQVYGRESSECSNDLEVLECLLPDHYGWRRVESSCLNGGSEAGHPWRVARLVRRVEFPNLPAAHPWLIANGGQSDSPVSETDAIEGGPVTHPQMADVRRFPMLGVPLKTQLTANTLTVPLLGELSDLLPDRRLFCSALQDSGPATVSIMIHPIHSEALADDRILATHLRRCLDPYTYAIAAAGFSSYNDCRRSYDRYWLPSSLLCTMTVRVAATSDAHALSLAHTLAANLGGLQAFSVLPPTRDVADQMSISDPQYDVPAERGAVDETYWDQLYTSWMDGISIARDPMYRDFLLRMPHLYTMDEAALMMRLPYADEAGLPGMDTRLAQAFFAPHTDYQPVESETPPDRIRLGILNEHSGVKDGCASQSRGHWHTLALIDLTKHALIAGSPGFGKTTTSQFLVRELDRTKTPFLAIEPVKTEYFDALQTTALPLRRPVRRWTLEGNAEGQAGSDFLIFDPMRLQEGVSVSRHVSHLKSCFCAAFPLPEWAALLLENGLREYYCTPHKDACGFKPQMRGNTQANRIRVTDSGDWEVFPSFSTFQRFFLQTYLPKAFGKFRGAKTDFIVETTMMFERRFENLSGGPLGEAMRRADIFLRQSKRRDRRTWNPFELLMEKNSIVELDALADSSEKSLAMAFLLTFLYERRQADDLRDREDRRAGADRTPSNSRLRHVLIVEEAHRVLGSSTQQRSGEMYGDTASEKSVAMFVDMLAEVRAYGQGLVVIEQIPSKIAPEAIKNTNLKIMLRLNSPEEREYMGEAMNFSEDHKKNVATLRTGECVTHEENIDNPVPLRIPDPRTWHKYFTQPIAPNLSSAEQKEMVDVSEG
jgi:hypothetical protein